MDRESFGFESDGILIEASYSYDSLGRERTVSYPSGLVIRKGYTVDGYLSSLTRDTDNFNYWTASAQDAWGNITAESYINVNTGIHSTYASTGQWQQKRWWRTVGNSEVERADCLYDSFGNLKRQGPFNGGRCTSSTATIACNA